MTTERMDINMDMQKILEKESTIKRVTGAAFVTCTELGLTIEQWLAYKRWCYDLGVSEWELLKEWAARKKAVYTNAIAPGAGMEGRRGVRRVE